MNKLYRRFLPLLLSGALLSALLAIPAAPVYAAPLTVTNLNDNGAGSLRQAIADAAPGDTIGFGSLTGTIILATGELVIDKNLTISGPGATVLSISGADQFRVFDITTASIVQIDHLGLMHGYSALDGGGVFANTGSNLTLDHITLTQSTAGQTTDSLNHNGAGIYTNGSLTVQNSLIAQNTLAAPSNLHATYGAGIYAGGPSLVINSSTVDGNTGLTVPTGGVAYGIGVNAATTTVSLDKTTISNNTNGFYGGGFFENGGTMTVTNSTFSGNDAQYGSAMRIEGSATVNFNNVTVAKNTLAGSSGALYILPGSTVNLHNSILADDTSSCGTGTLTSLGYNDVFNNTGCTFTPLASDISGDPLLSALANNGGPTQTMALQTGSPAMDAADNATCQPTDQRGDTRPFDGDGNLTPTCDMGAFELEAATTTTITADTPDPSAVNQPVNVTVTVTSPTGTPTGTVTVAAPGATCSVVLSAGTGNCNLSFTSGGSKTLAAGYPGDATHEQSSDTEAHAVTFQQAFYSQAANDGWVLESTETSGHGGSLNSTGTTLLLGDDNLNRQYRAILSFNTSTLPHSGLTITSVMLKLRKQSGHGINPFGTFQGLLVDIRKPFFSTLAGLQLSDFQGAASKLAVGTFGTTPVSGWYSVLLHPNAYSSLNLTGTTQFRLRFKLDDNNNHKADFLQFFSGSTPTVTNRPTLVVQYTMP